MFRRCPCRRRNREIRRARGSSGRRLAWRHGTRLDAGEMRGVMGEAAGRPELAIADAIDPDLDLLLHRFRDGRRDLRGDDRGVCYLGAGKPPRHVFPTLGRRQPADMRGSDLRHAPLHVPVLPVPACNSVHDNTMDIAIEPGIDLLRDGRRTSAAELQRSTASHSSTRQRTWPD